MPQTGVRDLKIHLSAYLRKVEAGQTVVITKHGKPIGRIMPVGQSTETQIETLSQAGLIAWNRQRLEPLTPVAQARGEHAVSDLLLADRE